MYVNGPIKILYILLFIDLQHDSGWSVDLLKFWVDWGTSKAGFFVKKPSGLSMTLTRSMGMTGKSSIRGLWVRPKAEKASN